MKDRTGEKFGKLTVVSFSHRVSVNGGLRYYWKCLCECGNTTLVLSTGFKLRKTCGCSNHGETHLMSNSPEHRAWSHLKSRCLHEGHIGYKNYGGRGIKVCDRWTEKGTGFQNFYADMGPRPSNLYSIDRIDNNGNYEPSNCRWATKTEQSNNQRQNRFITWNGVTKSAAQWAKYLGAPPSSVRYAIYNNTTDKLFHKYLKDNDLRISSDFD